MCFLFWSRLCCSQMSGIEFLPLIPTFSTSLGTHWHSTILSHQRSLSGLNIIALQLFSSTTHLFSMPLTGWLAGWLAGCLTGSQIFDWSKQYRDLGFPRIYKQTSSPAIYWRLADEDHSRSSPAPYWYSCRPAVTRYSLALIAYLWQGRITNTLFLVPAIIPNGNEKSEKPNGPVPIFSVTKRVSYQLDFLDWSFYNWPFWPVTN